MMSVDERLSQLEEKFESQADEIVVLKQALAEAVRANEKSKVNSDDVVVLKAAVASLTKQVETLTSRVARSEKSGVGARVNTSRPTTPPASGKEPFSSTPHSSAAKPSPKTSSGPRPSRIGNTVSASSRPTTATGGRKVPSAFGSPDKKSEEAATDGVRYHPLKGVVFPPTAASNPSTGPPESSLQLEFVYGYRGKDARNNVFFTSSGDVVYFTAALGVVYNKDEHSQKFFQNHNDDIQSIALHPNGRYVATGQVDPKGPVDAYICVWDTVECTEIARLQGVHSRGVCALAFSRDGSGLASVGNDNEHTCALWDWETQKLITSARSHTDQVFGVGFNPADDRIVTVGVKHVNFFSFNSESKCLEKRRGVFGSEASLQAILSLGFTKAGQTLTGTYDGHIYVWEGSEVKQSISVHSGPVFALSVDDMGIMSGSKDGSIALIDSSDFTVTKKIEINGQPVIRAVHRRQTPISGPVIVVGTGDNALLHVRDDETVTKLIAGHNGELWGLATHPEKDWFVTSGDDHVIRIWDIATRKEIRSQNLKDGARSAHFNPSASLIAVGHNGGGFSVLATEDLRVVSNQTHRKEMICDIKFSPNGEYLAVGSHDNFVDIYETGSFSRVGVCKGHSSYITHIDWSANSKFLQSDCGAYEHLYWQHDGQPMRHASKLRDEDWDTWTCVLGWPVQGVWPPGSDGTDVNAVDRSHNSKVLATGDDFGNVSLHSFPAVKSSERKTFTGHSSHVTNVRFTHDDRYVISTGGADSSVMQWKVV